MDQLFRLKFQMKMGQTESLNKIRGLRKDIARMKTIARQRELGGGDASAAEPKVKKAAPSKSKAKAQTRVKSKAQTKAKTKTKTKVRPSAKPAKAARKSAKKSEKK